MDEEFLLLTAAVALIIKRKKPKKKWAKQWLLNRNKLSHVNLLNELRLEPSDWRNYLRMDEDSFFQLLHLVTPLIQKKDTNMRQSISSHERLAATLRFLATGMNYEQLKYVTAISPQRLGVIIPETCIAILRSLKDYMKTPGTKDEWKTVAKEFESKWNFPNCLGAVDGKHIRITPPHGSGSFFWNYKHFNSIVLMACANANYEFIWCEVGTNGKVSDGGAIRNTDFYNSLIGGQLDIPEADQVNGSFFELSYVFVGDEAFSLRPDFMKPFNVKTLNEERRIFNYRLSRARRVVENAFGILANLFRILHTSINIDLHKIEIIVLTCCILHNFLRKNCTSYVTDHELEECAFENTLTPLELTSRNISTNAKLVRDMYVEYFNGEGAVEWQHERVSL